MAKEDKATFLWILCDNAGNPLLTNTGISRGQKNYSYRAETHAILSIYVFNKNLQQFFPAFQPSKVSIYTDSNSFRVRYNNIQQTLSQFPSSTYYFIPEWDIFQEIGFIEK